MARSRDTAELVVIGGSGLLLLIIVLGIMGMAKMLLGATVTGVKRCPVCHIRVPFEAKRCWQCGKQFPWWADFS